ncbi:hypothetical protein BU26DRAFT_52137 [Trematosphaeria pertusa]|uniref:RING-type domain-containing protein n=1 Tax=Trematosphaeria pertusa TaxID=390896 RepID=A0A6A6IB15_9PLEO|nr:uncharacterized protein BU26DRAFT_52137 [Trematosphaeria pertusa]KAF2246730.1 hypothetical protein BU26DRAFT_52137 [Trematosphaeria pertusa]
MSAQQNFLAYEAPCEEARLQLLSANSAPCRGADLALAEECSICTCDFACPSSESGDEENADPAVKLSSCGHAFHQSCVLPWTERSSRCPNCRAEMFPNPSALEPARHSIRAWNALLFDPSLYIFTDEDQEEDEEDDEEAWEEEEGTTDRERKFAIPFDSGDFVISEDVYRRLVETEAQDEILGQEVLGSIQELRIEEEGESQARREMREFWFGS